MSRIVKKRKNGDFKMTANCPICGGKWDIEDTDYEVLLRCGEEHDIYCGYCKNTIEFVLSRESLEQANNAALRGYESVINDLERQLKKERKINENRTN